MTRRRKKAARSAEPAQSPLTEAEWDIMKVVWAEEPCTAGLVQETLVKTRHWTYSTVRTTMTRMVEKGLLVTRKLRNLNLFSSAITEADARRREIKRTLSRAFDNALTPMVQFLLDSEEASKEELDELRAMILKAAKQ